MDRRTIMDKTPALNPDPYSDPNKGRGRQLNASGKDVAAVGYEVLDRANTDRIDPRSRPGISRPDYSPSGVFYDDA